MRHLKEQRKWPLAACLLLCLVIAQHTTTAATINNNDNDNSNSNNNYNCPEDCVCNVAQNTHTPLLHAKCSSLRGLAAPAPATTTYPLHSIDLSYLKLTNLSHALAQWPDVTSLDLSHNELHAIGHLGRRIKKLNLRHNRITSAKIAKLPVNVQVLNLQHNDITHLPMNLTQLTQLRQLELSHNDIHCTCETLVVRNWLQARHVFMEQPVLCAAPAHVKGLPWLQVRQAEICERERERRLQVALSPEEDENELMMGDQPIEGSGDVDLGDELGKDYIPIGGTSSPHASAELRMGGVEGSGDLGGTDVPEVLEATNDEDEGSGSGDDLIVPIVLNGNEYFLTRPVTPSTTTQEPSGDELFVNGMGIFNGDGNTANDNDDNDGDNDDDDSDKSTVAPEVAVAPAVNVDTESVSTEGPGIDAVTNGLAKASVVKQPSEDTNATYYLLGVIILIVVGLILFVGIKRCKNNADGHDVENPRQTELLDMDRKNPGKPLRYNGLEHAPLIGDKTKSDLAKPINGAGAKTPYDGADVKDGTAGQQQPLLNGENGHAANEPATQKVQEPVLEQAPQEQPPHEYYPITPRYPTPKSPRASKYAQYPQNNNNEPNNNNNNNNNNISDQYLPSSPKSGRYSPVYSPETGRVKIKLTETPRPKTPMLVTRTKSNAGDIITTPVRMGTFAPSTNTNAPATANNNNNNTNNYNNNLEVPAVHGQTVGGGGAVNGHVQH